MLAKFEIRTLKHVKQLAFNPKSLNGYMILPSPHFSKFFVRRHVRTDLGNMPVKFEVRKFY